MDVIFGVLFFLFVFTREDVPLDARVVAVENPQMISLWADAYEGDIQLKKTVGTHGSYGNRGFDDQLKRRIRKGKPKVTAKEYEKGLRYISLKHHHQVMTFIYMDYENTAGFVEFLEKSGWEEILQ